VPASLEGSYNGLTFGGATSEVHVTAMVGIYDLPDLDSTHQPKGWTNGLFRGRIRKRGLTFSFGFGLVPNTRTAAGYDTLLDTVLTAFAVQETADLPLRFAGLTKYINCHPTRRIVPIECGAPQIQGEITVEFLACDPTIFTGAPPP
jgi:hypothetical protein